MTQNRAQIKTEILAGLTTFLTMSYIIIVNPLILSTEGTGMTHSGVLTATVLLVFSVASIKIFNNLFNTASTVRV